jgi:Protein of unknown function (DUF3999)
MNLLAIVRPLVVAAAVASAATTSGAEKPKDFAFGIPLTVEADSAFYRAALPAAFYAGSARADQGDLRVFNGDDAVVPYARLDSPPATREKKATAALPIFPLRVDEQSGELSGLSLSVTKSAGKTLVNLTTKDGQPVPAQRLAGYLLDASDTREPMSAIVLAWAPKSGGMNTRIRVEASDDLNQWRTLVGDAPLLDLEYDGRRLVRDRVEFRQLPTKYLRISWPAAQAPLQLNAARAEFGDRVLDTPRQWTEALGAAVTDKENEYQFDLGGALPVDRIAIELPELNSVVPAQLLARAAPEEPWRPVTSLVSYRLRQDGGEISAPPLIVASAGYRYWLLRVDPKSGGLGRGQPRMRAGWVPQEIVFAARGTGPFLIAYGNVSAASSALPVSTLVPGYTLAGQPLGAIAVAHTGVAAPLGHLEQAKPPREYRRATLWGVLILGVVVLAWMAWQLSRQLNASSSLKSEVDASDRPA